MRMAQYIGLTNKAQTYANKKLVRIEDKDSIFLTNGGVVHRKSWLDLADNEHPMALYRDPIDEIYYAETVQNIAQSGGPMYFTMLVEYKVGQNPRFCEPWVAGNWVEGIEEYDPIAGVINILKPNTWEDSQVTTFPQIEDIMVYDHDKKHFVWAISRRPVMFYALPVGCESLARVSLYMHQVGDNHYIVKVNRDKVVFSIQKVLEEIKPGFNVINLKRRMVDKLKLDLNDSVTNIYR